jgi:hypothetical protein
VATEVLSQGTPLLPRALISNRHSHSIDQHLRLTVIHLVITLVAELKRRELRKVRYLLLLQGKCIISGAQSMLGNVLYMPIHLSP